MSVNTNSPDAVEHQALWFRFIVGRTVVTGALLLVLIAARGVVPQRTTLPLYLLTLTQFGVNGVYLYLWRKRDLRFLGYLLFGLEIILISLLIFMLGAEGAHFLLGYLWPIMMGGWLIGPSAVLPLTVLAGASYAVLIVLQELGIQTSQQPWSPGGAPLGAVLGLVYLISVALVVWVLNVQTSRQRGLLRRRNRALRRANADLRALLSVSEGLGRPSPEREILQFGLRQLQRLVGDVAAAAYVADGNSLLLRAQHKLDARDRDLSQRALAETQDWGMWERFLTGDGKVLRGVDGASGLRDVYLVPMSSPRTVEGCLAIVRPSNQSLTPQQRNLVAFLARSLGSALEGGRLLEDLRRERDLIVNVLNNLGEGVFVADRSGTIVLGNRAAQSLVGAKVAGEVPNGLAPAGQGTMDESDAKAWGDRYLTVRRVPLAARKAGTGGVAYVVRDVTSERELRQRQSDFVAYVAHELRTPLTTMRTLTGLLEDDDIPSSKRGEYLRVIAGQIERQSKLVRNLLDLSRLEAGHYDLPLDLVDVREVVRDALAVCRPLAAERKQRIQLQLPEDEVLAKSSADGLQQVLINLLSNAIKFTPPQGKLGVACQLVGAQCSIRVWDRGVGMTAEEQRKLFVKYASRSAAKGGGGTGLGLVISRMIVEHLGGAIDVESKRGEGSTFTVSIPLASVPREPRGADAAADVSLSEGSRARWN
jgi:signal transduction histidine kinase